MPRNQRHVVPAGPRTWVVKQPGKPAPISTHRTQDAADKAAKKDLRRTGGGDSVVHRPDGTIRDSDTVPPGRDPFPPRDTGH